MQNSKEMVLSALVAGEVEKMNPKLKWLGKEVNLPEGVSSWSTNDSLTVSEFLDHHPEPEDKKNKDLIALWGIAWELTWGRKVPAFVANEREKLLVRNRFRTGEISDLEKIWLKVIAADSEYF